MKIEHNPILIPDTGKMLFNGIIYSDRVYLGASDSIDNWHEVPREQYEQWLAEQEANNQSPETSLE